MMTFHASTLRSVTASACMPALARTVLGVLHTEKQRRVGEDGRVAHEHPVDPSAERSYLRSFVRVAEEPSPASMRANALKKLCRSTLLLFASLCAYSLNSLLTSRLRMEYPSLMRVSPATIT